MQNVAWTATKYILVEVVLDILYLPVWWYTKGLLQIARFCVGSIERRGANLSLGIWLKNMFTPMFGQYDWQGRMISFMMRTVMLVYKLIMFAIWIVIVAILFVAWIGTPAAVTWFVAFQWFGLSFGI